MEVEEQAQEVWGSGTRPDVVLCPVGGGGLLSGVAIASKGFWRCSKVVGTEPAGPFSRRYVLPADELILIILKVPTTPTVHSTARYGNLLSLQSARCVMGSSPRRVT